MSSTRYAREGSPIRQERYASSEVYKTALGGLLVAKRCGLLSHDSELVDLIWFIQWRSLADTYEVGGYNGSVESLASELLNEAGWQPPKTEIFCEDMETGLGELVPVNADAVRHQFITELARALRMLALDPNSVPASLPGLGVQWRRVLSACRENCREQIKRNLAPTTIAKQTADALRFAKEARKLALVVGRSRLGKSAAAKAFCAASGGTARYVLTPEDGDMDSFYRAIAKALGVADSHSRKASEVRDLIERMLMSARLLLVLDEAHNLFSGLRRVTRLPQRVLWLRRLIDAGVPIAFVALPEFRTRVQRCVDQLDWDAAQITELICREVVLQDALTATDFEMLVERLAANLSVKSKSLLVGSACGQHGAQYVVDTLAVAFHEARRAGRNIPSDDDVRAAIGVRPQLTAVPRAGRKGQSGSFPDPMPAPATDEAAHRLAERMQSPRTDAAPRLHASALV